MEDELLDLRSAAELLHISEKSLLRLLANEAVPSRKIVGKWRFSREALIRWIAEGNSQEYSKNANTGEDDDEADSI